MMILHVQWIQSRLQRTNIFMEDKSHVENSAIKMSRYVKIPQVSQALTHKTRVTKN